MAYYECVKTNIYKEINSTEEFKDKLSLMLIGLGIRTTNSDGSFKTMDEYFNDIVVAYLTYKMEVNEIKFI